MLHNLQDSCEHNWNIDSKSWRICIQSCIAFLLMPIISCNTGQTASLTPQPTMSDYGGASEVELAVACQYDLHLSIAVFFLLANSR